MHIYLIFNNQIFTYKKQPSKSQLMKINSITQYQNKSNNQQSQRINLMSHIHSTSTSVAKPSHISDIIECPLCDQSIRQAHMCPSCCKLFCQICIKNYIKNKKTECPNNDCKKVLTYNNLLNCSILGRQIEQALSKSVNKMKSPLTSSVILSPTGSKILYPKLNTSGYQLATPVKNSEQVCEKHQLKLDYYCQQCFIALCSDCAILSAKHQGHKLCKYSQKKTKFKQVIGKTNKQINNKMFKVKQIRDQLIRTLQRYKLIQNQKIKSLTNYITYINSKNIQNYQKAYNTKQQYFNTLNYNYIEQNNKYLLLSCQLQQKSTKKFIQNYNIVKSQATKLLQMQTQAQQNTVSDNPSQMHHKDISLNKIENCLIPDFEQKIYILDNYHELRQTGQVLISQPLYSKGTQWRLKIFPSGINSSKNIGLGLGLQQQSYLSIHLVMSKAHKHLTPNQYQYRIELVNQGNRTKCMSFQFHNDFKQGSEWCLDNFIKISSLYTENYIHPMEGYIEIILYIRCLSYYHTIKDQNQFIKIKEMQVGENYLKLANLRKILGEFRGNIDGNFKSGFNESMNTHMNTNMHVSSNRNAQTNWNGNLNQNGFAHAKQYRNQMPCNQTKEYIKRVIAIDQNN